MHKVLVIEPDTSIHEVARLMSKNETGSVLVKNGTRTGILTETYIPVIMSFALTSFGFRFWATTFRRMSVSVSMPVLVPF
ncbi:MAG: CBS domain-containing protein, partial [Candidatus Altiarchaeota archaeon]|nr:CBS domain-containing protein [Candidatus Altiarchaeota archaeon]